MPLLQSAKEVLKATLSLISSECLFFEWNLKVEDILIELGTVCLLQREYRSRVDFKYIQSNNLKDIIKNHQQQIGNTNTSSSGSEIEQQLDKIKNDDKVE